MLPEYLFFHQHGKENRSRQKHNLKKKKINSSEKFYSILKKKLFTQHKSRLAERVEFRRTTPMCFLIPPPPRSLKFFCCDFFCLFRIILDVWIFKKLFDVLNFVMFVGCCILYFLKTKCTVLLSVCFVCFVIFVIYFCTLCSFCNCFIFHFLSFFVFWSGPICLVLSTFQLGAIWSNLETSRAIQALQSPPEPSRAI